MVGASSAAESSRDAADLGFGGAHGSGELDELGRGGRLGKSIVEPGADVRRAGLGVREPLLFEVERQLGRLDRGLGLLELDPDRRGGVRVEPQRPVLRHRSVEEDRGLAVERVERLAALDGRADRRDPGDHGGVIREARPQRAQLAIAQCARHGLGVDAAVRG